MPSDAAMLVRSRALEAEARAARDLPPGDTHVVVHNDDQTPFVLVITILVEVFGLRLRQAMDQTLLVHKSGRAVVATLARADAEEKARVAMKIASLNGSSLQVTTEPATDQGS
jgi:ATP-dependent Clp protease adapter protein ClpS